MFKQLGHIFKGDTVIWMVFLFLSLISIVEVFSASSELTYKGGSYWAPVMKHGGVLFVGLIGIIITCHIPCKYFRILTGFFSPNAMIHMHGAQLKGEPFLKLQQKQQKTNGIRSAGNTRDHPILLFQHMIFTNIIPNLLCHPSVFLFYNTI